MVIGVPKEIKSEEYRVGLIPDVVAVLVRAGHTVLVQHDAGAGAGMKNAEYEQAGAKIVLTPEEVYGESDLVVKVKEPQKSELELIRENQMLFTFFHFSSDPEMTRALIRKKAVCVAYELVREADTLPILRPMSEIAGILAVQQGMKYLEREYGGKGILLSGVAGVRKGRVAVLGGGTVGFHAAQKAASIGAEVTVLEISQERMRAIQNALPSVETLYSSPQNINSCLKWADVVVGAVLTPGRRTPVLVREEDLDLMEEGSVLVDVSIDEGGVFATSRPTSHRQPIYIHRGIVHYCVPNLPGIVPRTSTLALSYASYPYLMDLAAWGEKAFEKNAGLHSGLALRRGEILNANLQEMFT